MCLDLGISGMDGRGDEARDESRKSDLRNKPFSDVHSCVDNVEADGDGEGSLTSGDYIGGLFLCKERGERCLPLVDRLVGKITAALAADGPRLDGV